MGQRKAKHTFGALEERIMEAVWRTSPLSVREVWVNVAAHRDLAYTTVMTVMNRLADQGILRRQRDVSGAYRYAPTQTREAFAAAAAKITIHDLVQRYGDAALAQFLDTVDRLPEEKVRALKRHRSS